ncbi:CoA transferase [Cupriavidus basilensis]
MSIPTTPSPPPPIRSFLAVGNDRQFRILCEYLDLAALADDERYATAGARSVNRALLKVELEARMGKLDGKVLAGYAGGCRRAVRAGAVGGRRALQHPWHTVHREMVVEMADGYKGLGAPISLSCTPATYRYAPAGRGRPVPAARRRQR